MITDEERREEAAETCTVEFSRECESELDLLVLWEYELSCGHSAYYDCQLPPSFCPECGKKVLYDSDDYI